MAPPKQKRKKGGSEYKQLKKVKLREESGKDFHQIKTYFKPVTSTSDKSNNATISATADPVAVDFDNLTWKLQHVALKMMRLMTK